ncbi:MAG: DUF1343 domain-containing protein [Bacteroidia bacterium]|nr:DUF1343 domain-containing protein [Bacteroidia bacterium]
MQYKRFLFLLPLFLLHCQGSESTTTEAVADTSFVNERVVAPEPPKQVVTGAEVLLRERLPELEGKRIALVANNTTRLPDGTHLVDALLAQGVSLVKVFAPEHGFRGDADAGQKVRSSVDPATGLPLVSLYGSNKKPSKEQLADVDLVLFDIQDVGARFYTYISTMSYVMEACAESQLPIWILDRPNPNGWYVDGPVLDPRFESFIGMHPIPIVHGMTVGDYARIVNGEGWLSGKVSVEMEVVACEHYRHDMHWSETGLPWVAPSPNLATEYAAYLYPALCWFEPTPVSIGRGTDSAFTMVGSSWLASAPTARIDESGSFELYGHALFPFTFTPRSLPGKSTSPKYQDREIAGYRIHERSSGKALMLLGVSLFSQLYESAPASEKKGYFKQNFERWPGNSRFRAQIEAGDSPEAIYDSWQQEVEAFKVVRGRYLGYE